MRLTTKGRFAVTAMIDLALRQHAGPVTLAGISERQKISLSYLEQLFGKCGGMGNCSEDQKPCMTHELWTSLNEKMFEYLNSVTLAQLVAQQRERSGVTAVMHDERPLRRVRRTTEELAAA